jgi:cysteine desulfurase
MQRIYLDANATTPVLPEVVEAMRPFWSESFGNPSSAHHSGQRTRSAVERARNAVATLLNAQAKEIVFTSGGTESDNLALAGVLQPYLDRGEPAHLITSAIEHHAVLYAAESLEKRGIEVTYLKPTRDGVIAPIALETALRPHTRLVSIMLANNETGAIQPVGKLARIAKAHNSQTLFHTDAVQAAAKLPLDFSGEFKNVDLLSLSGHKIYAPQGTGALFVRKGVQLAPLFHGGPHERQRRAGTENVPGIVALGRAAELAVDWLLNAQQNIVISTEAKRSGEIAAFTEVNITPTPVISTEAKRSGETCCLSTPATLAALRDRLETGLLTAIPEAFVNAANAPRVANTTNLRFANIEAESLIIALDVKGISASFGAACQSGATEPSHVLTAMGLTHAEARASIRFSLSRLTTSEEIDRALEIIPAAVARLRSLA